MDLFREAHHVPQLQDGAVVQDGAAAHPAEDLVLVGDEDLEVEFGGAVENGGELRLEAAVGRGEGLRAREPDRLQAPAHRRVPPGIAEDQRRQDPPQGVARREKVRTASPFHAKAGHVPALLFVVVQDRTARSPA